MRVGVVTVAFNEARFIKGCISQFDGLVDRHLVLVSTEPWHAGDTYKDDGKTAELAEDMGAEVYQAAFKSETEQRNAGQRILSDMDWILVVDADERYENHEIRRWITFLEQASEDEYKNSSMVVYWKDTNHALIEPSEGGHTTSVRPSVRFTDKRATISPWAWLPKGITMHHFSYVRTDEEMAQKLATFEHQHEIVPGWYENVWLKWKEGDTNLHPVNPPNFLGTKNIISPVDPWQ